LQRLGRAAGLQPYNLELGEPTDLYGQRALLHVAKRVLGASRVLREHYREPFAVTGAFSAGAHLDGVLAARRRLRPCPRVASA
jgi:hypothetical protein